MAPRWGGATWSGSGSSNNTNKSNNNNHNTNLWKGWQPPAPAAAAAAASSSSWENPLMSSGAAASSSNNKNNQWEWQQPAASVSAAAPASPETDPWMSWKPPADTSAAAAALTLDTSKTAWGGWEQPAQASAAAAAAAVCNNSTVINNSNNNSNDDSKTAWEQPATSSAAAAASSQTVGLNSSGNSPWKADLQHQKNLPLQQQQHKLEPQPHPQPKQQQKKTLTAASTSIVKIPEDILAAFSHCPYLGNYAEHSAWEALFEMKYGSIESYFEQHRMALKAAGFRSLIGKSKNLPNPPKSFFRVPPNTEATFDSLVAAVAAKDPVLAAAYMAALAGKHKGQNKELDLISETIEAGISEWDTTAPGKDSPSLRVPFVISMLVALPHCARQHFGKFLHNAIGPSGRTEAPVVAERLGCIPMLVALSDIFGVPEWKDLLKTSRTTMPWEGHMLFAAALGQPLLAEERKPEPQPEQPAPATSPELASGSGAGNLGVKPEGEDGMDGQKQEGTPQSRHSSPVVQHNQQAGVPTPTMVPWVIRPSVGPQLRPPKANRAATALVQGSSAIEAAVPGSAPVPWALRPSIGPFLRPPKVRRATTPSVQGQGSSATEEGMPMATLVSSIPIGQQEQQAAAPAPAVVPWAIRPSVGPQLRPPKFIRATRPLLQGRFASEETAGGLHDVADQGATAATPAPPSLPEQPATREPMQEWEPELPMQAVVTEHFAICGQSSAANTPRSLGGDELEAAEAALVAAALNSESRVEENEGCCCGSCCCCCCCCSFAPLVGAAECRTTASNPPLHAAQEEESCSRGDSGGVASGKWPAAPGQQPGSCPNAAEGLAP